MYFEEYPEKVRQSIWLDAVNAMSGYAFKYDVIEDVFEEFSPSQEMRRMILSGDYHGVQFDPDIPSALAALALEGDDATWDEIPVPVRSYRHMLRSPGVRGAMASANVKRVDKKARVPIYSFGMQAAKVSNRKAVRTAAELMADNGLEALDIIMIGEDPGTGDVVNLAIARSIGDGGFHVIRIEDRSRNGQGGAPYVLDTVWTGYRREDAVNVESQQRAKLLRECTWYVPGTKAKVRGCRRCPGHGTSSWPIPSSSLPRRPTPGPNATGWRPNRRRRGRRRPMPSATRASATGSWRRSASPATAV